jgi:hypothetical protein
VSKLMLGQLSEKTLFVIVLDFGSIGENLN